MFHVKHSPHSPQFQSLLPNMAFMFRILIHPMTGKPMLDKALAALKTKLEQRTT